MAPSPSKIRIVCISDTHNAAPGEGYTLPQGDVLIHAGDLTNQGSLAELKKAVHWIEKADFGVKIIVAGNHDLSLDPSYGSTRHEAGWTMTATQVEECRDLISSNRTFIYLEHSAVTVQIPGKGTSLRVFGSPFSPDRGRQNWAFQYGVGRADDLWRDVLLEVDILVTHTPSFGRRDASAHWKVGGCKVLGDVVRKVKPFLHVCGHCHEGRGVDIVRWGAGETEDVVEQWVDTGIGNKKQSLVDLRGDVSLNRGGETVVVNASIMAKSWGTGAKAFNKPIVVDIDVAGNVMRKV